MAKVIDFKAAQDAKKQRDVEQKRREFEKANDEVRVAMQRSAVAYNRLLQMGVQVG